MAIRAVLFDYGNVLVRWDPRNLYRTLFSDPAEMEHFLGAVCTMAWHARNDAGERFSDTTAALIAAHPRYAAQIRAWDERFGDMLGGEIEEVGAIVDRLHAAGLKLAILTNMSDEKRAVCFAPFSRTALFDPIIVSGAEGLAKPDPAIYALSLKRMGCAPGEVFFTDDSPANVEAAAAMGIAAHLFKSPAGLERALIAAGALR